MATAATVIEVDDIVTRFGDQVVHDGVSFDVSARHAGRADRWQRHRQVGAAARDHRPAAPDRGPHPPARHRRLERSDDEMNATRRRFGMMFQDGALFSSLTVARKRRRAADRACRRAARHARRAGAPAAGAGRARPDAATKMPSELSGGMRKRAAIARALALEPEVLFLDEPTSGLDPTTARAFDKMVRSLVDDLGITVFLVTHDLDTLLTVVDRIVVLATRQGARRRRRRKP